MTDEQLLLQRAAIEIGQLRETNRHMGARLLMFDQMMQVFNADSGSRNGMNSSQDIVWEINSHLERTKSENKL